ncbi:MAG TPA: uracil-DNA glycosylase [Mycobacteriales bacterium]|nr:uracil-DNA glycosylase [Mycobacteriales bacterium]
MTDDAGSLVGELAQLPALPHTFNPYRDVCPTYDVPDAAAIRRENVRALLARAATLDGIDVWIGREPGYLGARRTGVALTDEAHLAGYADLMGVSLRRATHTDALRREISASGIGRALATIGRPVFLWNICPLHTHQPDEPMSNKEHSRDAAALSRPILMAVLNVVRPRRVIALGDTAHKELTRLGLTATKIRHPAARGAKRLEFFSQVEALYRS